MRRPWGCPSDCKPYGSTACVALLTFPGHRRILLGITLARGANPTPSRSSSSRSECACGALRFYLLWTPSHSLRNSIGEGVPIPPPRAPPPSVRSEHGAPRAHPRVRARFACTLAQRSASAVPAISAHRSEAVRIPPPRAPPPAVRNARRRQLRRFSRASPIAGASGSPTAKLELRDGTRAFRALLAPAAAQQRNSNPSRQQEPDGELARAPTADASLQQGQPHCWRQRQHNGETRPRDDTRAFRALLAPAAAQRGNSNPAATLTAFVHSSRQHEPNGELALAHSRKPPLIGGLGGRNPKP